MNRHVPPHDLDRREAATFTPRPAPDFRSARRHSARVRWIKRLLPVSIVLAVLAIGAASILSRLEWSIELPFEIGHLTLSGSRLTMELPKLSGFTDDNRGYNVTAKTATQDITRPDVIDLTEVEARLEMADKGWAGVQAKIGSFDTKKQFITLGEGVDLAMNGGYGGHLQDAEIDVKAGTITTVHPVVFTYLDGKLVADRLSVTDRGKRAMFEGNVQLDFRPSSLPGAPKAPAETAAGVPSAAAPRHAEPAAAPAGARTAVATKPAADGGPSAAPGLPPPALMPAPAEAAAPALPQAPLSYAPLPPRRPVFAP